MRHHAHPSDSPSPSASKPGDWSTVAQLLPYLWRYRWRMVLALLCLVAAKVASVGVPVVLKGIIDSLSPQLAQGGTVGLVAQVAGLVSVGLLLAYGLLRLGNTLFTELRELLFARVTHNAVRTLALQVFGHLHALGLRFHLSRQTGGLTRDIERGTRAISSLVSYTLYSIVPTLVEVALVVGYLAWQYDIWFTVITLVALCAYVAFTVAVTEWRLQFRRTMNELDSRANVGAIDALINFETVKYFCNEGFEAQRYNHHLLAWQEAAVRSQYSLSLLNVGQSAIVACAATAVLWRAVLGVQAGSMSLGDLVLINAFMIQLYVPLNFLGVIYRELKQSLADVERLFGLLGQECEVQDAPNAKALHMAGGQVVFSDVGFAYDARRPILHNFNLSIPAGHTVAVVGASGAGKSTLSRLLYRFYDVAQGSIAIDGQDIRQVTQQSLRQHIGVVPQDTVLFNDTIAYNIAYGKPGAGQDEIEAAAKAAHIHSFIMGLPDGYQTQVGERGLKLSGGEKQRVAIARTMLKNPSILIFDEATSALDSHTEQAIWQAMLELAKHRTTLMIAHRLSTIVHAHTIVVLDQGQVVEMGTHQDLLQRQGAYARLWHTQHQSKSKGHDGIEMA